MTGANLKQLTKCVTRNGIHERLQGIEILSSIQPSLGGGVVLAEFTWYFISNCHTPHEATCNVHHTMYPNGTLYL